MKLQLKKLVGEHKLTYSQLYAVIVKVESILNSSPLLPIHVDPEQGPTIITPGHFLIGQHLRYPKVLASGQLKSFLQISLVYCLEYQYLEI